MKRHLTQFALVLLLPLIVLVGFFFWQLVLKERNLIENQTLDTAQALTILVDREIYGLQSAAEILGYSSILKTSQLDVFQKTITEMAQELKISITLYDPQAKVLVTSETQHPQDFPFLAPDELQKAARITKPYITGHGQARATAPHFYSVVQPVYVDGKILYYLGLSAQVGRVAELLNLNGAADHWIIAVIDQNDHILARNKDNAAYAGRLVPDNLRDNTQDVQGRWEGELLDGTKVLSFYFRSKMSDWRIVVSIKRAEYNRPMWNALGYFIVLAIGTLVLSAFLAGLFGRKISAPVKKLAKQAKAIGGSQPVAPLKTGIRELDVVSDALALADERRRKKEIKLLDSQLRLQMALDAGRVGIWEFKPETGEMTLDGRTSQMLAFQNRRVADFERDFIPSVHPDDKARIQAALVQVLETGNIVREVFRICDLQHENFVWVNGIGRRIYNDDGKPSVLGLLVNVTAEQMALEQREVIAQELNHRLKNMFAVIISLMNLSARGKTDVQDYVTQMRERMTALASAFELTYQKGTSTLQNKANISLNDLLTRLVSPYAFSEHERIFVEGDALFCPVVHVTPMSLVVHELVTNSVKHGSLSVPQGYVKIRLSKKDDHMYIEWREMHGPEVTEEPLQRGFGSRLKQLSIDVQMQGSFRDIWDKNGLVCIIRLPLPEMSVDERIPEESLSV